MGDESNRFHREVVRPKVSELQDIKENDYILDIACGNGNYSAYMAEKGAEVVAFDYNNLLDKNEIFVFATQHPCFVTLTDKYLTAHSYKDIAIEGQPLKQCYYHRSLQDIFHTCFQNGFVIDGFYEESYGQKEKPDVIIVRAKKI